VARAARADDASLNSGALGRTASTCSGLTTRCWMLPKASRVATTAGVGAPPGTGRGSMTTTSVTSCVVAGQVASGAAHRAAVKDAGARLSRCVAANAPERLRREAS
jgi:hypothetical protein